MAKMGVTHIISSKFTMNDLWQAQIFVKGEEEG